MKYKKYHRELVQIIFTGAVNVITTILEYEFTGPERFAPAQNYLKPANSINRLSCGKFVY